MYDEEFMQREELLQPAPRRSRSPSRPCPPERMPNVPCPGRTAGPGRYCCGADGCDHPADPPRHGKRRRFQ